jgi:hypothetical protein
MIEDNSDYKIDEFGRIEINDDDIMEFISGAGDLQIFPFDTNRACGSNGACGNAGCENLGC